MAKVKEGDQAPDFSLSSQDGEEVGLGDLLKRGSVVVYFYPKDRTPGCTAEAGAFRDSYAKFAELGAEVVGISNCSRFSYQPAPNRTIRHWSLNTPRKYICLEAIRLGQ